MPYSAMGYARRAAECARVASLTTDAMVQQELLRLRQTYLRVAEKLGMSPAEAIVISASPPPGQG